MADNAFPRTHAVGEIVLHFIQALAIIAGAWWTYNKWLRVDRPEELARQYARQVADHIQAAVDMCLEVSPSTDTSALVTMRISVRNGGQFPFGADTLETSVDWLEPARLLGRALATPIFSSDYDQIRADTTTERNSDIAPLAIIGPGQEIRGVHQYVVRVNPKRAYRIHAYFQFRRAHWVDSLATFVLGPHPERAPWHLAEDWAPGRVASCAARHAPEGA